MMAKRSRSSRRAHDTPTHLPDLAVAPDKTRFSVKPADGGSRPVLSGALATMLLIACGVVAVEGLHVISSMLGPILLAVILVITVFPVSTWLRAHNVPGWLATAVTILSLLLVLSVIAGSLAYALAQVVNTMPDYYPEFQQLYNQSLELLSRFGIQTDEIVTALRRIDPQSIFGYAQTFVGQISGFGSLMTVLLITMLFLTLDGADMPRRLGELSKTKPDLVAALQSFAFRLRRYWVVSTIFGLICAVLDTLALTFLSVPMAITFGVLAFVTNYIPNIGFVIGLVPAALMALLDQSPMTAVWVVVAYCAINVVIQTIIQPRFTGDAVGLSATTTFVSLLFWAWVLGALGALMAVPLTLFVKAVFIDRDPKARWLNTFISNTGT